MDKRYLNAKSFCSIFNKSVGLLAQLVEQMTLVLYKYGSVRWKQRNENVAVCWNTLRALGTTRKKRENLKDWAISRQP